MKKTIIGILMAIVAALGGYEVSQNLGADLTVLTQSYVASDTSVPAVSVLAPNGARSYARITNDSDTAQYLYFGTASTSVALNSGVRLDASGGTYEMTEANMYYGQIWATSTATSKNIVTLEAY